MLIENQSVIELG